MKIRSLFPCLIAFVLLLACQASQLVGQTAVAEPETPPAANDDKSTSEETSSPDDADETTSASKTADKSQPANEISHFLRISRDRENRALAMQTSVTRYWMTNEQGDRVMVDLIGVVHIGEKEYYEKFNELFEGYDTVLYELVAPEGTVIPKGGRDPDDGGLMNPIAALQKGMQTTLGLEFQLEHIDYTKPNFVHADMSPEEFGESMKNNEESISKMVLRAMGQSMALQSRGRGGDASMLLALFSKNKTLRLRRAMAEQMQNMEGGMVMFEGKDGSTIIDHRNAKAMEVLATRNRRWQKEDRRLLRCRPPTRYAAPTDKRFQDEAGRPILAGCLEADQPRIPTVTSFNGRPAGEMPRSCRLPRACI